MTDPEAELHAWAPKADDLTVRAAGAADGMWLPGYSDFRLVAEGGEGTVYRARQDGLDRYVAIKVITMGDPARLARFQRELEITVRLGRQHPHIVTVIDTGTAPGGRPCIVMEYYDLGSLHDRLRERGPLPVDEVVAAGVAVADALAFAHGQGFLHRDVKPQNILVLPTSYVLADFGIARMADAAHTTSLQMVSYRHAAPQMIDGAEPSAADDQWSLGSTLFTLLDGAPPFASDNPDEDTVLSYLDRVRATEPRQVRRSDVPPELDAVLRRCLSKRREDRFPDAAALRAALAAVDTGTSGWTPSMPVADFGPTPTPFEAEPPAPEPPARPDRDSERTTMGPGSALAGLTVRLSDRDAVPDFGPTPQGYVPTDMPPPVAVLPAPAPWPPRAETDQPTVKLDRPRERPPRRTGRRLLFAALAILVGGAVGFTLTVLNGQNEPVAERPAPTTEATTPSAPSTPAPVTGGDPAFAPVLSPLDDKGASITLTWTDPADGRAEFVVVDATDDPPTAIIQIPAGTTTYTVEGLDPVDRYCFQVIAFGLDDPTAQRGSSERACTNR